MSDITQALVAIDNNDPNAAAQLLPLVYRALRELAAAQLARERPGQTLEATALVHEAYLRLVAGQPDGHRFNGRGHFFAAAAEAMRRILVEQARRRNRLRHGGGRKRVEMNEPEAAPPPPIDDLLALDEALGRLAREEPEAVEVVKLRYFAGLTIEEAADALDISVRTANRHWAFARAWLYRCLSPEP
jgi:RNA polymerase sigma factor (TIGR02999 family)